MKLVVVKDNKIIERISVEGVKSSNAEKIEFYKNIYPECKIVEADKFKAVKAKKTAKKDS